MRSSNRRPNRKPSRSRGPRLIGRSPSRAAPRLSGRLPRCRGETTRLYLLELVASYFRDNEPSNPAPLLIDRARRLATMNFIDILRDLAPDGMTQVQIVAGQLPE